MDISALVVASLFFLAGIAGTMQRHELIAVLISAMDNPP